MTETWHHENHEKVKPPEAVVKAHLSLPMRTRRQQYEIELWRMTAKLGGFFLLLFLLVFFSSMN